MAINFVRQPSETPNVRNIDDIIPFRYAYGNQNGYVKDKGNELSYTINGSNFRINSGRVVLFGVESDIDANGVIITVPSAATTTYYSVYYHVNLATNTTSIESESSEEDYPEIPIGDDLTANTSGTANLVLYTFIATNGIISNVEKIVEEIDYINKKTKVDNATNSDNSDTLQNVDLSANSVATFGDYIVPKKRLLWAGNYYQQIKATDTSVTIQFTNAVSPNVTKIEIDWSPSVTINGTYSSYILCEHLSSGMYINSASLLGAGTTNYYIITCQANNTSITFHTPKSCNFDGTGASRNTDAYINKIYEIIE